jgi:hypothetical protein
MTPAMLMRGTGEGRDGGPGRSATKPKIQHDTVANRPIGSLRSRGGLVIVLGGVPVWAVGVAAGVWESAARLNVAVPAILQ